MLPNILSNYLERVEQTIQQCSNVYVERYEEEILTPTRANLRIRLRFNQTHLLEISDRFLRIRKEYNFQISEQCDRIFCHKCDMPPARCAIA
jgi:hypothetical protein